MMRKFSGPQTSEKRRAVRKFVIAVALAVLAAAPALCLRLAGIHISPYLALPLFFLAILAAGFLLSWSAETAEEHVSPGVILAVLALITVLPEYAVDIYLSYRAGQNPGSPYVGFAAANMTGANRLLIGTAWPLIVLLFWWRAGRRAVPLQWHNATEVSFLALASAYSFFIVWKGRIDLFDTAVLMAIFAAYIWRLTRASKAEDDDDNDEVGPAAGLALLSTPVQWTIIAVLTVFAIAIIAAVTEPFVESLIGAGRSVGINEFLLIQWLAPLASEAPDIVIAILFALALRPTAALALLISDKINQWTLLVGMIPLAFSVGAGRLAALPLDARQHEEFFLTAAQSLFAIALLLRLRLSLPSALVLLGLFASQFGLDFAFRNNEPRAIAALTLFAWGYLLLAALMFVWNWKWLGRGLRAGLLGQRTLVCEEPDVTP